MKQVNKYLRQCLAWCNSTGQIYDPSIEQYSAFLRAICDEKGAPRKGSKAIWTDKKEKRYSNETGKCNPVVHCLPNRWIPEVVIMDAMFLIQCNPLRQTMTIKNYAKLILNRFAMQHYQAGVQEVHIVFDAPFNHYFNPKMYEQSRRDSTCESTHEHIPFELSTKVPKSWRACIECTQCKRSIIEAIGLIYANCPVHYRQ